MSKLNKNFLWGGTSESAFRIEYSLGQQMLSPVDYRFEDIAVRESRYGNRINV